MVPSDTTRAPMSLLPALLLLKLIPLADAAPPCDVDWDGYQRSGASCAPAPMAVDCNDTATGGGGYTRT